jgi:hypothetical protein
MEADDGGSCSDYSTDWLYDRISLLLPCEFLALRVSIKLFLKLSESFSGLTTIRGSSLASSTTRSSGASTGTLSTMGDVGGSFSSAYFLSDNRGGESNLVGDRAIGGGLTVPLLEKENVNL